MNYYGRTLTAHFGEGFIGVYWGGDPHLRICSVDNNFAPPWNSTGAGRDIYGDLLWDCYGLSSWLAGWRENVNDSTFWLARFGLWAPRFSTQPFISLIIPTWPLVAMTMLSLPIAWRLDRRRPLPNHCRNCNYNLTANTSGVCPECGTPTGA